ncbi:hypothetical protein MMC29_001836 [Sticta canariensis]|nr:hypothetical protein [Sticta canariensis]
MPPGADTRLRWSVYTLMVIMAMLSIATAIVILAQCTPLAAGWDPRVAGKCRSGPKNLGIGYAHVAWSICTDFVCALFPILILWKSQMNKRTKYALWAIMGMGFLAGICCAIKTGYLGKLSKGDFTYNGVDVNIWGPLEENIGAIAASVPALQPLFKSLLRRNCSPSQSKPGARNNFILSTWRGATADALGTSSRAFNNTGDKAGSDPNEYILSPVLDRLQDDEAALRVRETKAEDVKFSREGIA